MTDIRTARNSIPPKIGFGGKGYKYDIHSRKYVLTKFKVMSFCYSSIFSYHHDITSKFS